jgi:hypothetical protein
MRGDVHECLNLIGHAVRKTAEWRREQTQQCPHDSRNVKAAEQLERLAMEIDALAGSETERQLREVYEAVCLLDDGGGWVDISATLSDALRSIGFHSDCRTGMELLGWYRNMLCDKHQKLQRRSVRNAARHARRTMLRILRTAIARR